MDTLLIVFLALLNGAFAMSEMSLAASRKARLAAMAETGDKGSQTALQLMEHPTQFLSSVQVGITSIGMLNGIVGEAAFSGGVAAWLRQSGYRRAARSRDADVTALRREIDTLNAKFGDKFDAPAADHTARLAYRRPANG